MDWPQFMVLAFTAGFLCGIVASMLRGGAPA
jgi:xanthosine utilization system XapX-like protein